MALQRILNPMLTPEARQADLARAVNGSYVEEGVPA
jgi:hypothetical protein